MKYSLNAGVWNSVFAVPSCVVDKYIKTADGASLKLLLYLLRHGGESFEEAELRETLGIKRDGELEDAAMFWFQRGVIRMDDGELTPTESSAQQERLPEVTEEDEQKPSSMRRVSRTEAGIIYTSKDIAQRINTDKAVKFLFDEAQALYSRPLKMPENRMLIQLTDFYGLPAEVAVMLLKYCFRIGKTSPNYILSAAQDWVNENIRTVADADAQLILLEKRYSLEENLRRAMDMKTKFSPNQLNFIKKWSEEWGFGEDMIVLAYEITLDNTGALNFNYTNKILENWKSAGIANTDDAKRDNEQHGKKSAKKETGGSSSIDPDDVMEELRRQYQ